MSFWRDREFKRGMRHFKKEKRKTDKLMHGIMKRQERVTKLSYNVIGRLTRQLRK